MIYRSAVLVRFTDPNKQSSKIKYVYKDFNCEPSVSEIYTVLIFLGIEILLKQSPLKFMSADK